MKYREEYRDPVAARGYADAIARLVTRPWKIMEVCGGQTHAIVRYGIDQLLPPEVTLIHGPGCPVCVTPVDYIDKAIEIASIPGTIFCSFGDMLRVPGSKTDLLSAKARGADVRVVYSPLDAVAIARANPDREVVFFAVGFETTAPANAMAAYRARRDGLANFSLLVSHVLVPPGDEGDSRRTGQPRPGLPRRRSCLRGHGLRGISPDRRALPRADRRHRFRAARYSRRGLSVRPPARGRPVRGREPVCALGQARRQCDGAGGHAGGLSRSSRGAGAASARSPKAAWRLPTPTAHSTPRNASGRSDCARKSPANA